jgi:hypothetical protein
MTQEIKEVKVKIINGPNEMHLMMSLMRPFKGNFDDVNINAATAVQFTVKGNSDIPGFRACINSMSREDGSGNSWDIEGYTIGGSTFRKFKGYYNSRKREGVITLTLD